MLWLWVLMAVVVIFLLWRHKEGLSPNAYELSQMSQGDLSSIDAQIEEIMATQQEVDEIKKCVNKNQENVIEIQRHVGKKDANKMPMAYPPLPPQKK